MAAQTNIEPLYLTSLNSQGSPKDSSKQSASPERDIHKQSEDYRRSVTIVFWYKANQEPLRLQQIVPTFPYFQLTSFPGLTKNLDLSPISYLDTYNAKSSQWEQHTIETVRLVFSQQRLLYRMRRSLLEGLAESECLGLKDEVSVQIKPPETSVEDSLRNSTKRPADDQLAPAHPLKIVVTDALQEVRSMPSPMSDPPPPEELTRNSNVTGTTAPEALPSISNPGPQLPTSASAIPPALVPQQPLPPLPTAPTQSVNFGPYRPPLVYPSADGQPPTYLQTPPPSTLPGMQYHHVPIKRWPNDYTVSEISAGFREMDLLAASTPSGGSGMTQRSAFERVFGSRYVKSTVCRHRSVWKKAPQDLKEQFERMGNDQQASWSEFVRRVEGRPPAKFGTSLDGMVFSGMPPTVPPIQSVPPQAQPASAQPPQSTTLSSAPAVPSGPVTLQESQQLVQPPKDIPGEAFRQAAPNNTSNNIYDPALTTQVA